MRALLSLLKEMHNNKQKTRTVCLKGLCPFNHMNKKTRKESPRYNLLKILCLYLDTVIIGHQLCSMFIIIIIFSNRLTLHRA